MNGKIWTYLQFQIPSHKATSCKLLLKLEMPKSIQGNCFLCFEMTESIQGNYFEMTKSIQGNCFKMTESIQGNVQCGCQLIFFLLILQI